ncbi:MAG: murein biosynthesis integral membrane protein MurJ [Spirochaetes bacterium]|nr:murein biosynthesis integral membrane protein MurJ [Spirochaetota bacterium]
MNKSIIKSTGIVAFSTLLSRIAALARDIIISSIFGATGLLDGFWVAFRIPNLFRRLVAEGCLTISFIPVYTEYLVMKGEEEALGLAQKVLSILMLVVSAIVALGIIFSPEIVKVVGYGFAGEDQIALTVALNRIMFPYLFFVSIVAFIMGYLNSHKYFFSPAFSPVLLNIGFIIGALFLRHFFDISLYGLALGVIIGGIMQLILQIPFLIKAGFMFKFSFDFNHPGIKAIFRMIGPALFGIAVYQINIMSSTILASMLPEGSITYIFYSDRLTELVFGLFIMSLGNVILPELSAFSASDNYVKINELYSSSIKAVLFVAIPASIALMVIGFPIVSVLFMRGQFTPENSLMTYKALFYASMGIASISVIRITVPTFYSLKDTKTPVIASTASFITNICFGYILMHTELKHGGLTLAQSIAATIQMLILILALQRKIGRIGFRDIILPVSKYILSGIFMALFIYFIGLKVDWFNDAFLKRLLFLVIIIITGVFIYFLACFFLRVKEIDIFKNLIVKFFKKFS